MTRFRRVVTLALLLMLSGCATFGGGLTSEEQQKLTLFQRNAQLYWEGQRYDQALDMVRKGLEVEPEDYKLLSLAGWVHLQLADRDARHLLEAEQYFRTAYDLRSEDDQQPHALLGFATAKQRLGREHARRAETLAREAAKPELGQTEQSIRKAQAEEHRRRAESHWRESLRLSDELIEREDLLRFAHKLKMETYVELNDYPNSVKAGEDCLASNAVEQAREKEIIRETMDVAAERVARADLQELIEQEERVRAALAEMHFRSGNYERAVEQLDHLLTMDPTRSTDYYNRGVALERLERHEEARRNFEKFLGTTRLPSDDERVAHAFDVTQRRQR